MFLATSFGCASAGVSDAGSSDAGQGDVVGHPDATTIDQGFTEADAGFPDPDAGFPDPDAGFPDAGFPDAGFPDAGPPPFHTRFQVVTGNSFSCALFEDGRVKCWGSVNLLPSAVYGNRPNTMGPNLPYLDFGFGRRVERLSAGQGGVCAKLEDGVLRCFGDNTYRQYGYVGAGALASETMPPPTTFRGSHTATAVALGWTHTCAILDDRSVACMGANDVGELGQGNTTSTVGPQHVDLGTGRTAKSIDADGYFSCAILDDDRLKCWGANGNGAGDISGAGGQLGTGDTRARGNNIGETGDGLPAADLGTNPQTATPWKVKLARTGITRTCAILENDRVKCIGRNDGAPDVLGTGDNIGWGGAVNRTGDAIPFIDLGTNPATAAPWRVLDLDVGDSMTCALLENGRLKCWGSGALGSTGNPTAGSLGDSPADMGDALAFLDLGTDPATAQPWQVQAVSCGKFHSCAVLSGNRVKCWGYNPVGQLGYEDNNNRGDNAGEMGDQLPIVQLE